MDWKEKHRHSSHAGHLYEFPVLLFPPLQLKNNNLKKSSQMAQIFLGKKITLFDLILKIFSAARLWKCLEFYRKDARTRDQLMVCELA